MTNNYRRSSSKTRRIRGGTGWSAAGVGVGLLGVLGALSLGAREFGRHKSQRLSNRRSRKWNRARKLKTEAATGRPWWSGSRRASFSTPRADWSIPPYRPSSEPPIGLFGRSGRRSSKGRSTRKKSRN